MRRSLYDGVLALYSSIRTKLTCIHPRHKSADALKPIRWRASTVCEHIRTMDFVMEEVTLVQAKYGAEVLQVRARRMRLRVYACIYE
jgi:hypothetical protein